MIASIVYGLFVGYFIERTNVYYHCSKSRAKVCSKIKEDGIK